MPNTEEQRLDVIENCDYLLDNILSPFDQTDDTPEGRMITQLKWLKERAENHDLPLPVDPAYLSTLRYVYTDGELCRHASDPQDQSIVDKEIENPMERILNITKKGKLLYKPEYKDYTERCIDALIDVLGHSERELNQYERGLIQELYQIKNGLHNGSIQPPLGSKVPNYPNYLEVDTYQPSISDISYAKPLIKLVTNLIFNGVRPDSWLTSDHADRETITMNPYAKL